MGVVAWTGFGIAVLCLTGWTAVLVLLSRSLLPMANALGSLNKLDAAIDERIARVVGRIQERAKAPKVPAVPSVPGGSMADPQRDALNSLFGGNPLEQLDDQPEAVEM